MLNSEPKYLIAGPCGWDYSRGLGGNGYPNTANGVQKISQEFRLLPGKLILKGKKHLWQEGRTEKEKADYGPRYIQRSFKNFRSQSGR